MAKGSGGAGRPFGSQREASRALRYPSGRVTTRGRRVGEQIQSLQGQITRLGNTAQQARANSNMRATYNAAARKRFKAQAEQAQRRLSTLQRRKEVLQRRFYAGALGG